MDRVVGYDYPIDNKEEMIMEAVKARKSASEEYGFHKNHGEKK